MIYSYPKRYLLSSMPRVRTADDTARRYLFCGGMTQLSRDTGIVRQTLYNRRKKPGTLTLDELALLVKASGTDAGELYRLVTERG